MSEPIWEEVELPAYDAICEAIRAYAVTLESGAQYTIASLKGEKECRERQLKAALAANREKDAEIERLNQLDAVVLLWRAEKAEAELSSLRASVGGEKWIDVKQELPTPGRDVLIYFPHWSARPLIGCYLSIGVWQGERILSDEGNPTHWQPLPAPPSLPTEKE